MPKLQTQATKPGLLRQLGFFSATALVISNMVGMGIFATTGFMAGDLGSASLILACWAVGALFAFAGALSYSELGINFPSSGGEYVYLTHAFGPEWGFMTGWVSFFAGFSAPIAAAALAFSDYLGYFFPSLKQANAHGDRLGRVLPAPGRRAVAGFRPDRWPSPCSTASAWAARPRCRTCSPPPS